MSQTAVPRPPLSLPRRRERSTCVEDSRRRRELDIPPGRVAAPRPDGGAPPGRVAAPRPDKSRHRRGPDVDSPRGGAAAGRSARRRRPFWTNFAASGWHRPLERRRNARADVHHFPLGRAYALAGVERLELRRRELALARAVLAGPAVSGLRDGPHGLALLDLPAEALDLGRGRDDARRHDGLAEARRRRALDVAARRVALGVLVVVFGGGHRALGAVLREPCGLLIRSHSFARAAAVPTPCRFEREGLERLSSRSEPRRKWDRADGHRQAGPGGLLGFFVSLAGPRART